jgi:ClpP class serine protease
MFSGEYWVGETAKGFGLVDHIGDVRSFLRQRFGEDVRMPLVASERSFFGRRTPGVTGVAQERILNGVIGRPGLVDDIISAIETRAIWARFGL